MAITIKSIKCPQCGSTRKKSLKERYYVCENCEAEYVVSDPNAPKLYQHVHVIKGNVSAEPRQKHQTSLKPLLIILSLICIVFCSFVFFSLSKPRNDGFADQARRFAGSGISSVALFENAEKKPVFIRVGVNRQSDKQATDQEVYIDFYLFPTLENIHTQTLTVQRVGYGLSSDILEFSNGELYLSINKRKAFRLDQSTMEFIPINEEIIQQHKEQLGIGIAEIWVRHDKYNPHPDTIFITGNDGISYYYFPITQQLLTHSDYYTAADHVKVNENLRWTSKFIFYKDLTSRERSSSISAKRLIQLTVPEDDGSPRRLPDATVSRVKEGSHDKQDYLTSEGLALSIRKGGYGITQFSDYTPDKLYFSPVIEFQNGEELMINFKPVPTNDESERILQVWDIKNKQIAWSLRVKDLPDLTRDGRYLRVWPFNEGYLLLEQPSMPALVLDRQGKVIHRFSTK